MICCLIFFALLTALLVLVFTISDAMSLTDADYDNWRD